MAPKADEKDKDKKKKTSSSDKTAKDGKDPAGKKDKSSSKDASGKDTKHKSSKDGVDGGKSVPKDGKTKSRGPRIAMHAGLQSCLTPLAGRSPVRALCGWVSDVSHRGVRDYLSDSARHAIVHVRSCKEDLARGRQTRSLNMAREVLLCPQNLISHL